jgi:hypothetical protein
MKAILSLLILLGSVQVFAQSAEMRMEFLMKQKLQQAEQKKVCDKNPEYCQVKEDITKLQNMRYVLSTRHETAGQICWSTAVRRGELLGNDGIVTVAYTPCEQIREYNQRLNENKAIVAKINAIDALLVDKNRELSELEAAGLVK